MSTAANIVAFMAASRKMKTRGEFWWTVALAIAMLLIVTLLPGQTPVNVWANAPTVDAYEFNTDPNVHTQHVNQPCMTYSGNSCINAQQWGFIDIDPVAKAYQMRSGVGKQGPGNQPPKTYIIGDCWQSGSRVAASVTTRKWVMVTGTPDMCAASGCTSYFNEEPPGSNNWVCAGTPRPALVLQVWKFTSGNWVWQGQVGAFTAYSRNASIGVVGDFGYMAEKQRPGIPAPPILWSKVDLNTMTIVQTGIAESALPAFELQTGVAGVTWTLAKIDNPAKYRLSVVGVAPPTSTPGGPTATATKTPTGGVPSKTPTALTTCCIEGVNCPPGAPIPRCTPTQTWRTSTPVPWRTATRTASPSPTVSPSSCGATTTALCLANRFRVTADWTKPDGTSGHATAIPRTSDTGEFWFFQSSNIEMVVKVLNGCGINAKWWAFAGGLTNVKVDWTVTDTTTGVVREYHNAQGVAFQPVQDTASFSCP